MVKKTEKDVLLDHNYDGIQELDNDLPPWWLWLFYATIIWSVIYLFYYHVIGAGDSSRVEYLKEMNPNWEESSTKAGFSIEYRSPLYKGGEDLTPLKREEIAQAQQKEEARLLAEKKAMGESGISLSDISFDEIIIAAMNAATPEDLEKLKSAFPKIWDAHQKEASGETEQPKSTEVEEPETEIELLTDPASLASGESIFTTNCATCHGKLGEGGIGPNLTDNYFLHGPTMNDMVRVINNGVPAKGMISWRGILKPQQIQEVASYIYQLRGTNPPNAKEPQGEKVEIASQ
jgi:mono/diheme cytochrome c family protein